MKVNSRVKNIDKIFKELVAKQKKDIPTNKKLQLSDIKRIARRISGSISDPNKCSIWSGYITNINNAAKGTYINFYFRKKKVALHRLLYINYVGPLDDDEYLKFNCENKGKCCNVHHMNKFKYNTVEHKDKQNAVSDNIAEHHNKKNKNYYTNKNIDKNKIYNDLTSSGSSISSNSDDLILTFD